MVSPPFMNLERRIKKLNKLLGDEFGWNPFGGPKFKWVYTPEMSFWVERDNSTSGVLLPNGLYAPMKEWDKHSWAEVHGLCWILATWKEPVEYTEWTDKYGTQVPWPNHGEYQLVENIKIPDGKEPDEDYTQAVIYAIRQHLDKDYEDHLRDSEAIVSKSNADMKKQWSDCVDDLTPAFMHVPGAKDHVSFGGM